MKNKKVLNFIVRIGISILFLSFLFSSTSLVDLSGSLLKTNYKVWVLCVFLYLLGQFICAYKWKFLAQLAGFKGKLAEFYDYYLVGMFFNLFLPTTVGGDVAKCYYLSKANPGSRKSPAAYSVLADRFTGVSIIVWVCTVAMFLPVGNPVPLNMKLFMVLMSLGIVAFIAIFPLFCEKFLIKYKWIKTFHNDIKVYWSSPSLFIKALYWSLLFHLMVFIIHVEIGQAIGLNISPAYYLIVYPMTAIAGFIPLSFNGLGPREAVYVYFLSLIGIPSSSALAFSVFWFAIVMIASLIGGIFYIKGKRNAPVDNFESLKELNDEQAELA